MRLLCWNICTVGIRYRRFHALSIAMLPLTNAIIITVVIHPVDRHFSRHGQCTSGAAAAAISLSIVCAPVLSPPRSKRFLHIWGGSKGRCPPCKDGYTSLKKYQTGKRVSQTSSIENHKVYRERLTVSYNHAADLILRYGPMQD